MELTGGHAVQLFSALLLGVGLFVLVYVSSEKKIIGMLILLIPFQIINSRYGSLNMVLTYLIGASLLIKGSIKIVPMFPAVLAILFAYFLSISQSLRSTYVDHLLYVMAIFSNFILLYIVYNFFKKSKDLNYAIKLIVGMNILVAIVGMLQLLLGPETMNSIGLGTSAEDFSQSRLEGRLVGVFGAPGINAEYYALQILLLGYLIMNSASRNMRNGLLVLVLVNFGLMIATGSRGSFLSLIGGAIVYLFFFRKELGGAKVMKIMIIGTSLFAIMAAVIVNFTSYNKLFDRLGDTEFEDGVPDTRKYAFDMTIERIPESYILGHGPRLRLIDEDNRQVKNYIPLPGYPHNLVLFLLYTVGVVGLLAYVFFFYSLYYRYAKHSRYQVDDPLINGIPKLALLLLIVFLVDQLKIEFLRFRVNDMQNYLFTLWAILLAFSEIKYDIYLNKYHTDDKFVSKENLKDVKTSTSVRLR